MSNENLVIAKTILEQMGGSRRLEAFLGAHCFVAHERAVSFKWKARSKSNYVKITLNSMDTYDLEFGRLRNVKPKDYSPEEIERACRESYKVVSKHEGIYFDQLMDVFERETGLYLSFNRRKVA